MAAMSRSLSKYMPANAPVTYFIFGTCCLLYGISLLLTLHSGFPITPQGGGIFDELFGIGSIASPVLLRLGESVPLIGDIAQPWRFVTACFLHGSLLHIGFNMYVLIDLGPVLEELYGSPRFLFIYIVTGIGGYILSGFFGHFSMGASGALVGLIGVLFAITFRRGGAGMQQLRSYVYQWIIYLVLWGFFFPHIDNMAHLGGGITGFILGKLMLDRQPATPDERKGAYALGWATAFAVLFSFGLMVFASRHIFFFRNQ